jgi:hypothetical protein
MANENFYYEVRCRAAAGIGRIGGAEMQWAGLDVLLKCASRWGLSPCADETPPRYFRGRYWDDATRAVAPNRFDDLSEYYLKRACVYLCMCGSVWPADRPLSGHSRGAGVDARCGRRGPV